MPVPEGIRRVPRPKNTVVIDSGHDGPLRYAVRQRAGVKYGPQGQARPINGSVIGHICGGSFVPLGQITRTGANGRERARTVRTSARTAQPPSFIPKERTSSSTCSRSICLRMPTPSLS